MWLLERAWAGFWIVWLCLLSVGAIIVGMVNGSPLALFVGAFPFAFCIYAFRR